MNQVDLMPSDPFPSHPTFVLECGAQGWNHTAGVSRMVHKPDSAHESSLLVNVRPACLSLWKTTVKHAEPALLRKFQKQETHYPQRQLTSFLDNLNS